MLSSPEPAWGCRTARQKLRKGRRRPGSIKVGVGSQGLEDSLGDHEPGSGDRLPCQGREGGGRPATCLQLGLPRFLLLRRGCPGPRVQDPSGASAGSTPSLQERPSPPFPATGPQLRLGLVGPSSPPCHRSGPGAEA